MNEGNPSGSNVHMGGSAYKFGSAAETFGKIGNAIGSGVKSSFRDRRASNKRMLNAETGMHQAAFDAHLQHLSTTLDREHHAEVLTKTLIPHLEPGTAFQSIDKEGYNNSGVTRAREEPTAEPKSDMAVSSTPGAGKGAVLHLNDTQFKAHKPYSNEVTTIRTQPLALEGGKATVFEPQSPSRDPRVAESRPARYSTNAAGETARPNDKTKSSKPKPSIASVKDASGNVPMGTKGKTLKGPKLKTKYSGFHGPSESTND